MATYHDPDEAVLRYFELRTILETPASGYPMERQGERYAESCDEPRCSKPMKEREEYSRKLGRIVMRCTAGHEWPSEDFDVPKRPLRPKERKGGRKGAGIAGLYAELTTLERWIGRIPGPDRAIYLLFLTPESGGYEGAVARANELGLAGGGWTYHRARRGVARAREVVQLFMRGPAVRPSEPAHARA